jgi:hypothetical protein
MPTENDLRHAIRDRADLAPSACPDLSAARPSERRTGRRAGLGVAAAAAAVVAVAVVPSLLHGGHSTPAASSLPAKPTAASVAIPGSTSVPLLAADTWISYSGADALDDFETVQAQYVELPVATSGFTVHEITAFAPGLFDPSLIHDAQPATVNGAAGYFGKILPWRNDDVSHTDPAHTDPRGSKYPDPLPAVVWQIGPDQWAAVISSVPGQDSQAALSAVAARVHATDAAVRTPIKIGYVPAGYRLSEADHSQSNPGTESEIGFRRNIKYDYSDWTVTIAPARGGGGSGQHRGLRAIPAYPVVRRTVGGYVITVSAGSAISKAQAQRVLDSITLADRPGAPNDSWFTLAQALP